MTSRADSKSNIQPLTGSSPPTGSVPEFAPLRAAAGDPASSPQTEPDAELMSVAGTLVELANLEDEAWGSDPKRPEDSPDQITWLEQARNLSAAVRSTVEELAAMPATTSAGAAAKAAALLKIESLREQDELVTSVCQDAVRLGALPIRLDDPVDAPLAAAWAEYLRLSAIVDAANAETDRLELVFEQNMPQRPDALVIRPDDFPNSAIRLASREPEHADRRFYSEQAVNHLRHNPRQECWESRDVATGALLRRERRPDPVAQARADEIIAAHDAWCAECRALRNALGLTAAEEESDARGPQMSELAISIRDVEARSVRGLGIKASWALMDEDLDRDTRAILEQVVRFVERCAAPVISGASPPGSEAELAALVQEWAKLGLQVDEAEGLGVGAREERARMRELHFLIRHHAARTFRGLLMKSLLLNGGERLRTQVEVDTAERSMGTDQVARAIALDLVEMAGILPQEWPFIGSLPVERPNRRALEAYRTWLSNEFRSLTAEMYPDHPEMTGAIALNNAGDRYHFRGEPPASSRAERVLAILGLDWVDDKPAAVDPEPVRREAAA